MTAWAALTKVLLSPITEQIRSNRTDPYVASFDPLGIGGKLVSKEAAKDLLLDRAGVARQRVVLEEPESMT